jgi:pimeloyl-ACP methyl ester carboxylesterase
LGNAQIARNQLFRHLWSAVGRVTHRQVDAGGLRVNLAEAGEGEPVILLHGWPQDNRLWEEVIARLQPQYRLLAPDLRGFGQTEAPGHGYDGETFARDQIALLDALGIERANVVGHDWGGWTAMILGLNHSERIGRLMVINAPHPWPRLRLSLIPELWRSWYALALATPILGQELQRRTDFAKGILRRASPPGTFTTAQLDAYADDFREPARAKAISALYRYYHTTFFQVFRGGWRDRRLTVPTLVLFGIRDLYITSKLLEGYEPYADQMRVEAIPDTGHFLVDERPDLVADRVGEHFA